MISCSSMQTYLDEARSFHLAPVERNKAIRLLWLIVAGYTHIVIAVGLLQELLLVRFQVISQLAHNVIPTLAERRIYVSRDLTLIQRSHHVVFLT